MAVQAQFQVEGFEELFAHMDELKEEIGKGKTDYIWRNAMRVAMQPVLEAAISLAPKDTGQLSEHLYLKIQKPENRDKKSKYYDGEMIMARVSLNPEREDTVINTVLNKRGKFQNYKVNKPVGLAEEFGTARNGGGKPFLRPALESNAQLVMERLGSRLWSELNSGKFSKWEK